jgi:predicted transcriptional regulator
MAKRVTIMLDDDLDKKIRLVQAKAIQSTNSSVSFSSVLNEILRNKLKK